MRRVGGIVERKQGRRELLRQLADALNERARARRVVRRIREECLREGVRLTDVGPLLLDDARGEA